MLQGGGFAWAWHSYQSEITVGLFFRMEISFVFDLTVSYLSFGIEVKNGRVKNDPREGRVQTCSRPKYAEELKL